MPSLFLYPRKLLICSQKLEKKYKHTWPQKPITDKSPLVVPDLRPSEIGRRSWSPAAAVRDADSWWSRDRTWGRWRVDWWRCHNAPRGHAGPSAPPRGASPGWWQPSVCRSMPGPSPGFVSPGSEDTYTHGQTVVSSIIYSWCIHTCWWLLKKTAYKLALLAVRHTEPMVFFRLKTISAVKGDLQWR